MFPFTLLRTLYHEIASPDIAQKELLNGKDRRFHSIDRTYDISPEIHKVTVEERFLTKSTLYYIWVNDVKTDLNNPDLCSWIVSFFQEYRPTYLKEGTNASAVRSQAALLDSFEVDRIPSHRQKHAYADMEITTMEDVRNGTVKKDTRRATFPGMTFAK